MMMLSDTCRPARFKFLFFILLLGVWIMPSFADVTISRSRISTRSPRVYKQGWTDFECLVSNTDPRPHKVEVRVTPKDDDMQTGFFSGVIRIPAETEALLRFPIRLETAEEYVIRTKCDGVRMPNSVYNDTLVTQFPNNARSFVLLNDADDSPGAVTQFPRLKGKIFIRTYSADSLSSEYLFFMYDEAIVLYKPDFSKYSQEQFNMLRAHVANGGKLIFLTPDAILAAAETPLRDMLPVIPLSIRRVEDLPALRTFLPNLRGFPDGGMDFLVSLPCDRGVDVLQHEGMPLIRIRQFGLGTVETVHIPYSEAFTKMNQAASEDFLLKLLARQGVIEDRQSFVEMLDKLTGFAIPDFSRILHLILAYLGVFFAILILGFILNRAGTAWLICVLFAGIALCVVLNMATKSFGERHSVLAEIAVKMTEPFPLCETYASCFSMTDQTIKAEIPGSRARFTPIPQSFRISSFFMTSLEDDLETYSNGRKKTPKTARIVSPVEIVRDPDDAVAVSGLHVAPRTSKQFMSFHLPRQLGGDFDSMPKPELLLSETGMELASCRLPAELMASAPESVWLVMPGGVRRISLRSDGSCSLAGESGIFVDPMSRALIDSLSLGIRKPCPYLAVVSDLKENTVRLHEPMLPQGKTVHVIPVRLTVTTRRFRLPPELLLFSPDSSLSRSLFRGNSLIPNVPLMTGQGHRIRISVPEVFADLFHPEEVDVSLQKSVPETVRFSATLINHADKNAPVGCNSGTDGKLFFRDGLANAVSPEGNAVTLSLDTTLLSNTAAMSPEQAMYSNRWMLRHISASIYGSLDESVPLPAKF